MSQKKAEMTHPNNGSAALTRASEYLHHLLNQSLSGLDFCILWQELVEEHDELQQVHVHVTKFLEDANLAELDRALALLPEPESDTPQPLAVKKSISYEGWTVQSQRQRDVSRADFKCNACGFEITLAQEHAANTEMRLPFDDLECPICSSDN